MNILQKYHKDPFSLFEVVTKFKAYPIIDPPSCIRNIQLSNK